MEMRRVWKTANSPHSEVRIWSFWKGVQKTEAGRCEEILESYCFNGQVFTECLIWASTVLDTADPLVHKQIKIPALGEFIF